MLIKKYLYIAVFSVSCCLLVRQAVKVASLTCLILPNLPSLQCEYLLTSVQR